MAVASDANRMAYSSSAVLPIPASPRTTSVRLSPRRMSSTSRASAAHSLARPSNTSDQWIGDTIVDHRRLILTPAYRRSASSGASRDELLPPVDVVGRAGDRSVDHEVNGERGDVGRAD